MQASIESPEDRSLESIYDTRELQSMIHERQRSVAVLFILCLLFFFSLPLLSFAAPELLKIKLFGAFNVGLLWAIMQYPIGGIIAWCYVGRMRSMDRKIVIFMARHELRG